MDITTSNHTGDRRAHFVGALPYDSAEEAMGTVLRRFGSQLRTMPDGETGAWRMWFVPIFDGLRDHPDLKLAKDFGGVHRGQGDDPELRGDYGRGDWQDYDHLPKLALRSRVRNLDPTTVRLHKVEAFRDSYPVFTRLRDELALEHVSFQVGLPADWDMSIIFFGVPLGPARIRRRLATALVREITEIHREAAGDVVFQLETPFMTVPVMKAPGRLKPLAAKYFARKLASVARRCPDGSRFGIHLCVGDLHHRAAATMAEASPVVELSNAIADSWPDGRALEFIHMPFAAGIYPAPEEEAFYRPLSRLRVPGSTRIVAGLVHEEQSLDTQRRLVELLDDLVGRPVDVANACGLGRLPRAAAAECLERTEQLLALPFRGSGPMTRTPGSAGSPA